MAQCYSAECPFYGPNRVCSTSDGCPGYVAPTNADRIRGMSDEELANMLYSFEDLKMPDYCQRKKECDDMLDADIDIPAGKCIRCLLDWLRQPAEEVTT